MAHSSAARTFRSGLIARLRTIMAPADWPFAMATHKSINGWTRLWQANGLRRRFNRVTLRATWDCLLRKHRPRIWVFCKA